MAFASKALTAIAALALLSLGACATDGAAPGGVYGGGDVRAEQAQHDRPPVGPQSYTEISSGVGFPAHPVVERRPFVEDELLSSPPNNARAGDCYAKVVVPGQPIGPPPAQPRAVWVQTPPGPGQISPTWCIYYEQGAAPQPMAYTPERYGWIRVVCERDATVDQIRRVQQRLHAWGDYDGAYDGHYDAATARGVVRFQEQRHIEHGGYLSVRTVKSLDDAPPAPVLTPAFDVGRPNLNTPTGPAPTIYASPIYQRQAAYPATYQPAAPTYQQPVYASGCGQPACAHATVPQVFAPQPQPVYTPPTVIYQKVFIPVIQPVIQQQVVTQYVPQYATGCGQPACQPQSYPCTTCGSPMSYGQGGYGQGGYGSGGYGQNGTPPYRALLNWPGKSTY